MKKHRNTIDPENLRYQKIFNTKLNKRSTFLKNLCREKEDGLKNIEEEKVDILINRFLGRDHFERNYAYIEPSNSPNLLPKKKVKKFNEIKILPQLKILITSPIEKDFPDKYRKKEVVRDKFSNIFRGGGLKKINSFDINSNKCYKVNDNYRLVKINKNEEIRQPSSFLSNMGKNIIVTKPFKNKDMLSFNLEKLLFDNKINITNNNNNLNYISKSNNSSNNNSYEFK